MKRTMVTALAGLLVTLPVLASAGGDERVLVIVNKTRVNLEHLYTSPVEAPAWGADQLGSIRIGAGGNVTVKFQNETDACMYDLMMVFSDGEKLVRRENICASGTLIIHEPTGIELPSA